MFRWKLVKLIRKNKNKSIKLTQKISIIMNLSKYLRSRLLCGDVLVAVVKPLIKSMHHTAVSVKLLLDCMMVII